MLHTFFESARMMIGIVELLDNDILHVSDNPKTAEFPWTHSTSNEKFPREGEGCRYN
jgi:hypothetical protein